MVPTIYMYYVVYTKNCWPYLEVAMVTNPMYCASIINRAIFSYGCYILLPLPLHFQLVRLLSMSSTDKSNAESNREHVLWEQGDSDISTRSSKSLLIEATVLYSQSSPFSSQVTTSGLNRPMTDIACFFFISTNIL